MSKCNIDHSHGDVVSKFESQKEFLPESLVEKVGQFLKSEQTQETLNELFHLLKKYDLASGGERKERDQKLEKLVG